MILSTARASIAHGWSQPNGPVKEPDGQCISSALWAAGATQEEYDEALPLLFEATGTRNRAELYAWNDEPGRTKSDVLAAYDKAALLVLV